MRATEKRRSKVIGERSHLLFRSGLMTEDYTEGIPTDSKIKKLWSTV